MEPGRDTEPIPSYRCGRCEMPVLAAVREHRHLTVNGWGLLLNQGRVAFDAWFGIRPEITPALLEAVAATF
jgi:shikimate dehydrogenase